MMNELRLRAQVAGMAAVAILGGCAATGGDLPADPPSLTMLEPAVPNVTIYPTRVTVKNARGDVLLDGAPDKDNRLAGNPAPSQFDGTLQITTQYDNGSTKTQTLTHDPARRVGLAWDNTSNQYVVRELEAPRPADRFVGQPGWGLQIFGDYKRTPFGTTTVASSGSSLTAHPDLADNMSSLGVGLRRYFTALPNGVQPFAYAAFSEYFNNGASSTDLTYHFGTTADTGASINEQRSFLLGVGGQFELPQRLALQLMVGLHATRLQMSVFSDERSGGGPNNVFQTQKWIYGPTFGAGLSFPLMMMSGGSPLIAFLQYQGLFMRDVSVSGTSPFTLNTYSLSADGGLQNKIMFGLETRF
jgi:hypothetical protein